MARNKNDYFRLMEEQVYFCVQAAKFLEKIFSGFSAETIEEQRYEMHSIEHSADEKHHTILSMLSSEFITPIDQEDILLLVQLIDDVTDALDEVVLELYMYHVDRPPVYADEIVNIVCRCVGALHAAVKELKNFKKTETLRPLLVEVNDIESEADTVYIKAVRSLFGGEASGKILIGNKAIYDSLENCCDLCEHAADVIEQIIIKNT